MDITGGKLTKIPLGPAFNLGITDYEGFREDMKLAGVTVREMAEALGRNPGAVYGWKQSRVPDYAKAWVDLKLQIKTLQRDAD